MTRPIYPKPVAGALPLGGAYSMLERSDLWLCQPKIDGWRAWWVPGNGLVSSSGNLLDYPEELESVDVIVDGELTKCDGVFHPFDLPEHQGPLDERIDLLYYLTDKLGETVVPVCSDMTWERAVREDHEGVVFKLKSSTYPSHPGVTSSWVKFRRAWL